MLLVILLFVPIAIAAVIMLRSKGRVTWYEFLGLAAILTIVITTTLWMSARGTASDVEILNGKVVDKTKLIVSCSHTYSCNCRQESYWVTEEVSYEPEPSRPKLLTAAYQRGGSRSYSSSSRSSSSSRGSYSGGYSTRRSGTNSQNSSRPRQTRRVLKYRTVCDTCRRHEHDIAYFIHTSFGDNFRLEPPDGQGLVPPERWLRAYVGEPASKEHTYDNYLKSSPDSVLRRIKVDDNLKGTVPKYPRVHDLYKVLHFLADPKVNMPPETAAWYNEEIGKVAGDLGAAKQVNIMMLVVSTPNPSYEYALESDWVGGKKNDLIVLVGSSHYPKIDWVRIVSWTPSTDLKVELRDKIFFLGSLDKKEDIVAAIRQLTAAKFKRMEMKQYRYLLMAYQPSGSVVIFLFMFTNLLTGGFLYWSWNNEWYIGTRNPNRKGYGVENKALSAFRGKR